MSVGEVLMASGAAVWLVGEVIGLTRKDTTSHFVKLWAKSAWWHRVLIVVVGEVLVAHFNGAF